MKDREPVIEVIDDDIAAVLRKMTGAQKLRTLDAMFQSAAEMIESSVRETHPNWPQERVRREVAKRIAGDAD